MCVKVCETIFKLKPGGLLSWNSGRKMYSATYNIYIYSLSIIVLGINIDVYSHVLYSV